MNPLLRRPTGAVPEVHVTSEMILLAGNAETAATELAPTLRSWGYHVAVVRTHSSAGEFLRQRPHCAAVLVDLSAPSSVFPLAGAFGPEDERPGLIFRFAEADSAVVADAFRQGAADVLFRNAGHPALQAALNRACEDARLRRDRAAHTQKLERLLDERTGQLLEMMSDLERSYDVTIEAMGDALDLRDEETEGHSKRVTAYTIELARAMGVSSGELKVIARGAFLHDIGKIAIPDSILLKPGQLTTQEMNVMRRHCEHGYSIVRKIPFLSDAAEIVYSHQERFDGSGYPRGLYGHQIPLGARIFAVADTLDAITSDRPYRRSSSVEHAVNEIRSCRGRQFDPEIVNVFMDIPLKTWTAIRSAVGRHSNTGELVRSAA